MSAKVSIRFLEGPMSGQVKVFDEPDLLMVGRHEECQLQLPQEDTTVSRYHMFLEVSPPQVSARDLGSLSGVVINGVKHGGRDQRMSAEEGRAQEYPQVALKHGDKVRLGQKTLLEILVAAPDPAVHLATVRMTFCQRCQGEVDSGDAQGQRERVCRNCRTVVADAGLRRGVEDFLAAHQPRASAVDLKIQGFALTRRLGAGAMGEVYEGVRDRDGLKVALKVMQPQLAVDDEHRQRFLREIQQMAMLRHPNVVEFMDWGRQGELMYLAMEFCPGGSLGERQAPMPWQEALRYTKQALAGLAFAHERGNVHRDIKPDNLMLGANGEAKVGDFGLSKSFHKAGLSGLTATGTAQGTALFMPREQLTHFKTVRPSCDVWSMAATFYHLVTGAFPREPQRPNQNPIEMILTAPIRSLASRNPGCPPAVAQVIDRALENDLRARYEDAGAFLRALEAAR